MDRFLLEVYCPANAKTYEFWLAKALLADEAALHIACEIAEFEQTDGLFDLAGQGARLYSRETQAALSPGLSLQENGIESGWQLIIV